MWAAAPPSSHALRRAHQAQSGSGDAQDVNIGATTHSQEARVLSTESLTLIIRTGESPLLRLR